MQIIVQSFANSSIHEKKKYLLKINDRNVLKVCQCL